MDGFIRDLYARGGGVYLMVSASINGPSPKGSWKIPPELAERLFEPAPSPKGGRVVVVKRKLSVVDTLRMISIFPGGIF